MNHELNRDSGLVRAHGSPGAFVSTWTIDRETLRVVGGEDLARSPSQVYLWNPATGQYAQDTTTWDRLCSADLPAASALRHGNRGTAERIFFDGEETSSGRAWARIVTGPRAGQAWELPRLGKMAFENVVASPYGQDKTVVALLDDGNIDTAPVAANNPSEVFIFVTPASLDPLRNSRLWRLRFDDVEQPENGGRIALAEHILGEGWFLLDVQVHKPHGDPELVAGGQLLAMYVDPRIGRQP